MMLGVSGTQTLANLTSSFAVAGDAGGVAGDAGGKWNSDISKSYVQLRCCW